MVQLLLKKTRLSEKLEKGAFLDWIKRWIPLGNKNGKKTVLEKNRLTLPPMLPDLYPDKLDLRPLYEEGKPTLSKNEYDEWEKLVGKMTDWIFFAKIEDYFKDKGGISQWRQSSKNPLVSHALRNSRQIIHRFIEEIIPAHVVQISHEETLSVDAYLKKLFTPEKLNQIKEMVPDLPLIPLLPPAAAASPAAAVAPSSQAAPAAAAATTAPDPAATAPDPAAASFSSVQSQAALDLLNKHGFITEKMIETELNIGKEVAGNIIDNLETTKQIKLSLIGNLQEKDKDNNWMYRSVSYPPQDILPIDTNAQLREISGQTLTSPINKPRALTDSERRALGSANAAAPTGAGTKRRVRKPATVITLDYLLQKKEKGIPLTEKENTALASFGNTYPDLQLPLDLGTSAEADNPPAPIINPSQPEAPAVKGQLSFFVHMTKQMEPLEALKSELKNLDTLQSPVEFKAYSTITKNQEQNWGIGYHPNDHDDVMGAITKHFPEVDVTDWTKLHAADKRTQAYI